MVVQAMKIYNISKFINESLFQSIQLLLQKKSFEKNNPLLIILLKNFLPIQKDKFILSVKNGKLIENSFWRQIFKFFSNTFCFSVKVITKNKFIEYKV